MRQLQRHALPLFLILLGASASWAQSITTNAFRDLPPPTEDEGGVPLPKLGFQLKLEIPLPGPLPADGARWEDDHLLIPVADGTARTRPESGATVEILDLAEIGPPADASPWVENGLGRRFRAVPEGLILAEKRCKRCADGWKKSWKLRVAGTTPATPLADGKRVFFGARDNRIYSVKSHNGHRTWAAAVEGRVTRPLGLWKGPDPNLQPGEPESTLSLILVVPDNGTELVALDGTNGREVASVRFPPNDGRLIGAPRVTPDGDVVVALQKYAARQAALLVFGVRAQPATTAEPEAPPLSAR